MKVQKKKKAIPKFKNEDDERKFWATHDSTEYVDWDNARRLVLPNLKQTPNRKRIVPNTSSK